MPKIFSLIGESWDFCKRQHAINHVAFWFIFLPTLLTGLLTDYVEKDAAAMVSPESKILVGLGYFALTLVTMWGVVCVLHIGKRLLQAKSGRTRSSFKSVRAQARPHFIPYVLTTLLGTIFTILWSLLLLIPGLIYTVRIIFYPVIVVCEGEAYRAALKRSKDVVRGQFWPVTGTFILLYLLTFVPAQILNLVFVGMSAGAPMPIIIAAQTASAIVISLGIVLYTLSSIQAYGYFKRKAN